MKQLTSASVHYFRLSTARWERILDRLQASGFGGVDLYIPWSVHEKGRGDYDFGDGDRSLDLTRFLSLIEGMGMWVILRPGPHVNAELRNFGLPERIVKDPGIQARSPGGNQVICPFMPEPFPAPSYASELFLEETRKWFGALGSVIGEFLRKPDFVKMVQVDNEASLFFRDGPFDQDYRPEAAAMYRQWLENQSLEPHDPPVRLEPGTDGLRSALLWIRFRQWLIVEALKKMRGYLKDAGVKAAAFCHNLPPGGILSPVSPSRLKDAVDRVTTDIYVSEGEVRAAMNQVIMLSSVEEEPFAGELGSGTVFYAPYITEFENKYSLFCALACGLKGFNLYMGTARDRWIGGMISEEGEVETASAAHFYQRLFMMMDTLGMADFHPQACAAIVAPRIYGDHSIAALAFPGLSPTLVSAFGLGLTTFLSDEKNEAGESVQVQWMERVAGAQLLLKSEALFYTLSEGEDGLESRWFDGKPPPVILVPTFTYIDARVLGNILDCADKGSRVVAGPGRPELDGYLKPLDGGLLERFDGMVDEGKVIMSTDIMQDGNVRSVLDEIKKKFFKSAPLRVIKKNPDVEVIVHRDRSEGSRLVYVINPVEAEARTVLETEKGWTCARIVHLSPHSQTGEFARKDWGREKSVILDHKGRDVSLLRLHREEKKKV